MIEKKGKLGEFEKLILETDLKMRKLIQNYREISQKYETHINQNLKMRYEGFQIIFEKTGRSQKFKLKTATATTGTTAL